MSAHAYQKASARVFTAVLATIAVDWKQPKCPSTVEKTKGILSKNINYMYNTNTDGSHKNCVETKKLASKEYISCGSIHIKHKNRKNYRIKNQKSVSL